MKTNTYKAFAATMIALMLTSYSFGQQWTTNSSNIYNNNTGNVGFSPTGNFLTPAYQIDCKGDINLNGSTNALRLGTNKIVWHGGNTADIFVGVNAGNGTMTGHYNTFMGNSAGTSLTSGTWNTAIGFEAMKNNTICMYNTAVGYQSLYTQSTCSLCWDGKSSTNTAVGYQTLYSTSAYGGCALGYNAAFANTTGCSITAMGENALANNVSGDDNVSVGGQSCYFNVSGSQNTCMGDAAGHGASGMSHSHNSFFWS